MAPKKATAKRKPPTPRGNPSNGSNDFSQMFSEQLAASMPDIVSQISASILQSLGETNLGGSGSGNGVGSGSGGIGQEAGGIPVVVVDDPPKGCTYKAFLGCKPLDFKGTEGAVGTLRWIEKTESVLEVCGCAEDCKVKYATHTFQGKALTWWNTEVRTRGRLEINAMTWEQLKAILIQEYCPDNEIQRIESELWSLTMQGSDIQGYTNRFYELSQLVPHLVTPESKRVNRYIYGLVPQIRGNVRSSRPGTLQSAIVLAGSLTDDAVRDGTLPKYESKKESGNKRGRNFHRNDSRKKGNWGNDNKQQTVQNYAAVVPEKKGYQGNHPKCDK